ncbi:MAG TPA: FKBP-type peptidyl-prolyl cis-trans isomerase [Patescibacteria group bacterium]|nr:FKBP-type peptidyl-prolyl cis-trans isomerase [Patescibacteria group bacterium]
MKALILFIFFVVSIIPITAKSLAFKNDTITTDSGLKYIITKKGSGPKAKANEVVIAHYTGTLLNGEQFDSSRERNEPFAFTLGRKQVIRGWDEAFALLKIGDRATLIIPPNLAYGDRDRPKIPANSTLIFDVEFLDVRKSSVSDLLSNLIRDKGIGAAIHKFNSLKKGGFKKYYMSEADLNRLGYELLHEKKTGAAIEIFKLNAQEFPESFNVYDSLGEAYMIGGFKDLAIENYKKSLALNPNNTNAAEMLQNLQK